MKENKILAVTFCKLHCGAGAACRLGFPHDCHRPRGRTITRNPQRQLTIFRCQKW